VVYYRSPVQRKIEANFKFEVTYFKFGISLLTFLRIVRRNSNW